MNIKEFIEKGMKESDPHVRVPKGECEVIIYDFDICESIEYCKTTYVLLKGEYIKRNNKPVAFGKHYIQLPIKTALIQLNHYLEVNKITNHKNLHLKITKKSNYEYIFKLINHDNLKD